MREGEISAEPVSPGNLIKDRTFVDQRPHESLRTAIPFPTRLGQRWPAWASRPDADRGRDRRDSRQEGRHRARVLWLLILRQRNVDVSGLDYFKVGVVVTPLMLLAGAFDIWLLL